MKVAIYARVSTRDKGQDNTNQLGQMREWAFRHQHEVVAEYCDEASGSGKVRRPQFELMMYEAREKKFEMLLFWSLDRLSREGVYETLKYLKDLDGSGVRWRSHTEAYLDSCGVFREAVLAILAAIAKQERIRISERVRAGLEIARAKGRRGGRPKQAPNLELRSQIVNLRLSGGSIQSIAGIVGVSKSQVHRIVSAEIP